MTKRPTIADIAARAGLSKGAVSYALNDRPGVSAQTRERVLRLAAEMNWYPNSAARALSASRAGALGLALARPASTLGVEPFFMKLISGIEAAIAPQSVALQLQVVPDQEDEIATYRRWWAERRVDGVFLVDLRVDDPRITVLEEIGLPAVVIGGPGHHGGLPGVWSNDAAGMSMIVEFLVELGHRRIAHVAGLPGLLHTELRREAFDTVAESQLEWSSTVSTDYSAEQGLRATRTLLGSTPRPTAIVYDNDVMAVAGTTVAHEMSIDIPAGLSIVAWDDSVLCEIAYPPLSVVSRDIVKYGTHAAEQLLAVIAGHDQADFQDESPQLISRGSTGPAPA